MFKITNFNEILIVFFENLFKVVKINNYDMIYIGILSNWTNHIKILLKYFSFELIIYFYIDFNIKIKQTILRYY